MKLPTILKLTEMLDFLLVKEDDSLVIDSKYKPNYKAKSHNGYHEDIRQVSGYARLKKVRKKVGLLRTEKQLGSLIIYPDQTAADSLLENLKLTEIEAYEGVWKIGLSLPELDKRDKQK
jgi:5-methylcytosine-specific restriction enzyme subunit McrC